MNPEIMKQRTRAFALAVIEFVQGLPSSEAGRVLGRQLLRAGISVGANYRAACRAKSTADFISKMGTVEEEADESSYWLELLLQAGLTTETKAGPLIREAGELLAITVASINTARQSGGRK